VEGKRTLILYDFKKEDWDQMPEATRSHQGGDRRSRPKMEQVSSDVQAQAGPPQWRNQAPTEQPCGSEV